MSAKNLRVKTKIDNVMPTATGRRRHFAVGLTLLLVFGLVGEVSATPLQDQIDATLRSYVAGFSKGGQVRVEANWTPLDARVQLPPCPVPPRLEPVSGQHTNRISVRLSCEQKGWSFLQPLVTKHFGPVVVTTGAIARDQPLNPALLTVEERELSFNTRSAYQGLEQLNGYSARRNIMAGQILTMEMLKAPKAVTKGQTVVIEAASKSFAIRTTGVSLTDGAIGDIIRVKNAQSGKIVEGAVVEQGKIRITL